MQKPKKLTNREMWPLVIIDLNNGVRGAVAMQKYGFLVTKLVLDDDAWYKDWRSNNFGMYSCELNDSLLDLESRGFVKISNHNRDKKIKRGYVITDAAKKLVADFKKSNKAKVVEIKKFLKCYNDEDLLIADAYMRYPEYTDESKIKRKVQENILKRVKPNVKELVLCYDNKKIDLTEIVKKSAKIQYGIYDEKFTENLAKKIGMEKNDYMPPIKGDLSDIVDFNKIIKNIGPEGFIELIESECE